MKKAFAMIIFCCAFIKASSQNFYDNSISDIKIIKVVATDTPFIKINTSYVINEKGEQEDIKISSIVCSICTDSLIAYAKVKAIQFVKETHYPPGRQDGKIVRVKFNQPVKFTYPDTSATGNHWLFPK